MVDDEGETVTEATGTGAGALTISPASPDLPSLMATILVEPGLMAVTSPVGLTDAMSALSLDHATVLSCRTLSLVSRTTATACVV
jgi:hypothetical protein